MSLFVASINSGSNGNCYYVGNSHEAVLVDAGISCREIERRMSKLGLSVDRIKAIFISHEHSDHIRGVEVLSKKHEIPVYINTRTHKAGGLNLRDHLVREFQHRMEVTIGGLNIMPFQKHHDAADPYSFNVSGNGVTIGVFTDIGHACKNVISHFQECHAVFLETNYDTDMLDNGFYPPYLKRRIKSDQGHLSNEQALELFQKYRSPKLSHLFLSHLSKENNSPQLVEKLFVQHAGSTKVTVASRYHASDLYQIHATEAVYESSSTLVNTETQLRLF
jgi:phosphoribosyl 1,2-cyclic phosphodiesterase